MRLYLCEKPSQAKSLAGVLGARNRDNGCWRGDGVVVTYAIGHLLQQVMPEDYDPKYKSWSLDILPCVPHTWRSDPNPRTIDQYKIVRSLLSQSRDVVIATDADREGEVIAREMLDDARWQGKLSRLWVSDSTDAGIRKGLNNLKSGDVHAPLYQAGLGRMRADWLAGMNLTRGLSAFATTRGALKFGRVQTPTLTLVVRRERAITNFKPIPYFVIVAHFGLGNPQETIRMRWLAPKEKVDDAGRLVDQNIARAVVSAVREKVGEVDEVEKTAEKTPAPLLYYLGSLQKECSAKYGFSPNRTLEIVQALYQEHKLTTYPRTDCEYISDEMHAEAPNVIAQIKRVNDYAPFCDLVDGKLKSRAFNTAKVAASAHHAIIPTANPEAGAIFAGLDAAEKKVYALIVKRYLAQFLGDYQYERTCIKVLCGNEQFEAVGNVPTTLGWKRVYANDEAPKQTKSSQSDADDVDEEQKLPSVNNGDRAINVSCDSKAKKTSPPKRYTEGTLLTAMESIDKEVSDPRLAMILRTKEKAGIGTDATRGEIIAKLIKSEYIAIEKKYIVPTTTGTSLVELMERECPALVDLAMTAVWEDKLNDVAKGQLPLADFESMITKFVEAQIDRLRKTAPARDAQKPRGPAVLAGKCPACEKPMSRREGANGAFWGCTGYPSCKTTLPDADGKPGEARPTSQQTPSKAGKIGAACPTCSEGKLTQKATAQGKPFIGCTKFPTCRHFQWINA